MNRPMLVKWGDAWKPAPCTEAEFTALYDLWVGPIRFDVKSMSRLLREKGYGRAETIELLVLLRRRDQGGVVVI